MKFHLHVVDGGAALSSSSAPSNAAAASTTESSAVLLFAHMTLRCGHLADVVAVSASTTPAAARQAQLLQQAHGTGGASGLASTGDSTHAHRTLAATSESEDTTVLQAAGAVLTGAVDVDSDDARGLPYAPLVDGEHAMVQPYAYFTTPFGVAEQSLRRAAATAAATQAPPPPYFDLVATTDMTTFEYVLDYYQQLRVRHGGSAMGGGAGRGTKPVGVLHIVAEDPSRAARVLQRVLEMVLKRSGCEFSVEANAEAEEDGESGAEDGERDDYANSEDDEEANAAGGAASAAAAAGTGGGGTVSRIAKADSWANHIDEAVHLFAQLFGVDVLVALV